jgi:eukaryotic-like serine/threonine-protein kinase
VRTRVLGEEHPNTLTMAWNLGISLLDVGDVDAALRMLRKCFDSRYRVLGDQHPDTIAAAQLLMRLERESESGGAR